MTSIVVAADLTERSAVALRRAGLLADRAGAELIIVHAIDEDLPLSVLARRKAEATEILGAPDRNGAPPARVVVEAGDVYTVVPAIAEATDAMLVVAGDHRRSRLRDLFRDTTVERLIRISSRPVLIARSAAMAYYANPLIAVEGDEAGELLGALETVCPDPARAIAVHAHGAPAAGLMFYAGISSEAIEAHRRTYADQIRSRLGAAFAPARFPVDIRVVDAVPLEAIRSIAEAERSDLIVVSTHARRAPLRGLLGSVSSTLIQDAGEDLLIVPRKG
jgi:nucleotide-binding universal stress UspA family protein